MADPKVNVDPEAVVVAGALAPKEKLGVDEGFAVVEVAAGIENELLEETEVDSEVVVEVTPGAAPKVNVEDGFEADADAPNENVLEAADEVAAFDVLEGAEAPNVKVDEVSVLVALAPKEKSNFLAASGALVADPKLKDGVVEVVEIEVEVVDEVFDVVDPKENDGASDALVIEVLVSDPKVGKFEALEDSFVGFVDGDLAKSILKVDPGLLMELALLRLLVVSVDDVSFEPKEKFKEGVAFNVVDTVVVADVNETDPEVDDTGDPKVNLEDGSDVEGFFKTDSTDKVVETGVVVDILADEVDETAPKVKFDFGDEVVSLASKIIGVP